MLGDRLSVYMNVVSKIEKVQGMFEVKSPEKFDKFRKGIGLNK